MSVSRSLLKTLCLGAAASVLLVACDNREERVERAGALRDAVSRQLAEDALGQNVELSALERAPAAERAVRGQVFMGARAADGEADGEAGPQPAVAPQASRFAVGSIIAKPAAMPSYEAVEYYAYEAAPEGEAFEELDIMEDPVLEMSDEAVEELEAAIEDSTPRTSSRIRALELPAARQIKPLALPAELLPAPQIVGGPRAISPNIEDGDASGSDIIAGGSLESALPSPPPMAVRRMAVTAPRLQAQDAARSRMLDAMDKYGLQGSVELDRSGNIVIQLGSDGGDPTQFRTEALPEDASLPGFAIDDESMVCDNTVNPQDVQDNPVLATTCVIQTLRESGEFEYVEKDFIFEHQFAPKPRNDTVTPPVSTGPNDPLYALQWHFRSYGTQADQSPGGAGFADAWKSLGEVGSDGVVVAVVDTGLQLTHPDIIRSPNVRPGFDFVSDPRMGNDGDGRDADPNDPGDLCDPNDPYDEDSFHGTHVAGIVGAAASDNGLGISAAAWKVSIVPVRAMGRCGGRLSDINDGIRWAAGLIPAFDDAGTEIWNDHPADIINLSIGLFESCPASLQDAIDAVSERGVIVVAAAGNARIATRYYAPGGCRNVVSVAAGDARGQLAPYSNYGPEVDVLAPGGDLTRDDNGDGQPDGVLSTKSALACNDPVTGKAQATCDYAYEQGTSMAAPHVSAAFVLLKARYPEKSSEELIAMLTAAVEPRDASQCAGQCLAYPGATPIPGTNGLCARPCGTGLLNLARLPDE